MSYSINNTHTYSRLLASDGSAVTVTAGALDVNMASGSLSVDLSANTSSVQIYGDFSGTPKAVSTNTSGHVYTQSNLLVQGATLFMGQAAMADSLPVTLANDQTDVPTAIATVPKFGTHANVWNGVSVSMDERSSSFDVSNCTNIAVFGTNEGGFASVYLEVSQDDTNFYANTSDSANASGQPFYKTWTVPARYVRFYPSSDLSGITMTVVGKGG